jgi:hypothetical protein
MAKNVLIRAFQAHLTPDENLPGVFVTGLGGIDDNTVVTVEGVTKIDDSTVYAMVSMVTEYDVVEADDEPAPDKPKLVVAR